MLLKPPVTPVTLPASAPLTVQVFATLSAVRLFTPVSPPLIAPLTVPPLKVKLSDRAAVQIGDVREAPVTPVTVPASAPVSVQVFATLSPVSVFAPVSPAVDRPAHRPAA